jgi:trehalose 6-phosphate synthase
MMRFGRSSQGESIIAVHAGRPTSSVREESRQANRLLVVSNRGPLAHHIGEDGALFAEATDGGVSTALSAIARSRDVDWVACAATDADAMLARRGQRIRLSAGSRLTYVAPPPKAYELFYNTVCNPLLWFTQHGISEQLETRTPGQRLLHAWQLGYLPVNQSMAEFVAAALRGRIDRVMFHDYHFYLAPLFVRNLNPQAVLQHFVHIPWPDPAEWMHLPRRLAEAICRGLLANDSVTFQTAASSENFLATCAELNQGVRVHFEEGVVETSERLTRVWANPISVDPADLQLKLTAPGAKALAGAFAPHGEEKTILRVDRLDPTKNILAGFEAFEMLLKRKREWVGRVRFLAFLVPSRTSIPEYASYAGRVFSAVERINARFGTPSWQPVQVYHERNRLQALVAMRFFDVLLVNSLADGMNLVAKEGSVINERDGVLVLSKAAGSFAELGGAAVGINPLDTSGTADALQQALEMPSLERHRRARELRQAVLDHTLGDWLNAQLLDIGMEARGPVDPGSLLTNAWADSGTSVAG